VSGRSDLSDNLTEKGMSEDSRIIFLTDLIDTKVRKEKEIDYYEKQLIEIEKKLFYLRKEQDLTKTILGLIESEKIIDLREYILEHKPNDK
tara:strand:+ start:13429 stop:13701 length:273 start_codon:yes stop_codon:yes gene_type:complete